LSGRRDTFLRFLPAAGIITAGLILCLLAIHVGETDDAPGASLLGILVFIISIIQAWRIIKRSKHQGA